MEWKSERGTITLLCDNRPSAFRIRLELICSDSVNIVLAVLYTFYFPDPTRTEGCLRPLRIAVVVQSTNCQQEPRIYQASNPALCTKYFSRQKINTALDTHVTRDSNGDSCFKKKKGCSSWLASRRITCAIRRVLQHDIAEIQRGRFLHLQEIFVAHATTTVILWDTEDCDVFPWSSHLC